MKNEVLIRPINTMNDAMFKAVMTSPNNREMVVDIINSLTGIDKEKLKNATYIGGEEIAKRNMKQKGQRIDMTIKIQKNFKIIVEMNQSPSKNIFDKNELYGLSGLVENTGIKVTRYPRVIIINIDNFNKFKTDEAILEFFVQDKFGHIESEMYKSVHLILANVKKSPYNIDEEIKKFTEFFKDETTVEELENIYKGDEKYMAAVRTVEQLSSDPEFQGYYDIEEAHRQELEDVKETYLEEGAKEANIETARNFLIKGFDVEVIAECTGLSLEEVSNLKESNND